MRTKIWVSAHLKGELMINDEKEERLNSIVEFRGRLERYAKVTHFLIYWIFAPA